MKQLFSASFSSLKKHYSIKPAIVFLCLLLVGLTTFSQMNVTKEKNMQNKSVTTYHSEKHPLTYQVIPAEQNTFGYDIREDNRLLAHQPSMPGLPGNKGFYKREDAEKTARLVICKINKNIMPPSVAKQEMDYPTFKF